MSFNKDLAAAGAPVEFVTEGKSYPVQDIHVFSGEGERLIGFTVKGFPGVMLADNNGIEHAGAAGTSRFLQLAPIFLHEGKPVHIGDRVRLKLSENPSLITLDNWREARAAYATGEIEDVRRKYRAAAWPKPNGGSGDIMTVTAMGDDPFSVPIPKDAHTWEFYA